MLRQIIHKVSKRKIFLQYTSYHPRYISTTTCFSKKYTNDNVVNKLKYHINVINFNNNSNLNHLKYHHEQQAYFSTKRRFGRRRENRKSKLSTTDGNNNNDNNNVTTNDKKNDDEDEPIDTSNNKTLPLHDAAEMGNYDKIVHLIKERGIDVNMKDAARSNATALHIASRSGHLDIVKFLSESGADLNAKGPWDMTPLMYGIIFHRLEIVKYLLGNNVDATVEDNRGRTALIHAVNERQEEMERLLRHYLN